MLSYYYYFLGELLGERNYIIIIFLEYDKRQVLFFCIPSVKSYSEELVLSIVLGQSQGCYLKSC